MNVSLHGTRPWHRKPSRRLFLAASVSLHGARPWYQFSFTRTVILMMTSWDRSMRDARW